MTQLSATNKLRLAILVLVTTTACRQSPPAMPVPAPKAPAVAPAPSAQNPSPMVETARKHDRIQPAPATGIAFKIDSVLSRSVDVFIPEMSSSAETEERRLLVHLFSAAFVPMRAVADADKPYVLALVNMGGGSSAYERPFSDTTAWPRLLQRIRDETASRSAGKVRIGKIVVSAFSAGYGGVRALLGNDQSAAEIDAIILLDGLHTSYIPERKVLSDGGALDSAKLVPFLRYARRAVATETRLVITHSEIFPGTFASTTETTDWLISAVGLKRTPVLAWGPVGMQQISEVRAGGLLVLGYAGNTGPDHIDHLHGLPWFLKLIR